MTNDRESLIYSRNYLYPIICPDVTINENEVDEYYEDPNDKLPADPKADIELRRRLLVDIGATDPEPSRLDLIQRLAKANTDILSGMRTECGRLITTAMQRLGIRNSIPTIDIDVRELDPERDCGLTGVGWRTGPLVGDAAKVVLRWQIPTYNVVAIYGVFTLAADPVVAKFRLGHGIAPSIINGIYHMEPMYALPAYFAMLYRPVLYLPQETLHLTVWASHPAVEQRFGLVGLIGEPIGISISEPAV